ncbi:lysylphosphatidylglycerol synthase domain-containing protein [Aquipuribacter hungaricus]|uniref:lysylphosphatidylglycerol synthase domain-containing protein n=1 Tax=Aquipuribacter hungaricus TaxID=545624 RepID=UPI0030EF9108
MTVGPADGPDGGTDGGPGSGSEGGSHGVDGQHGVAGQPADGQPVVDGPPAVTGRGGRALGRLARVLPPVVLVAVLAVGGWYVWTRRAEVGAALADIGVPAALGCLVLTLLGVLATGECWRVWLASLAPAPPRLQAHQVFYLTQAGKYLPGSLWPFLAQALLARRSGVTRAAILTATTLFLLTHLVTGAVVGVALAGPSVAAGWAPLLYPAASLGLLALCPPVLGLLLRLAERVRGRDAALAPRPTWSAAGRAAALMLLAWAAYGTSTWLLLRPLDPGPGALRAAVGACALAWVVGFLAVAAPAGAGAREAVLVLVLAPLVGAPPALAVALVSRVALTAVDLGLAAASSGVLRILPPDPDDAAGRSDPGDPTGPTDPADRPRPSAGPAR